MSLISVNIHFSICKVRLFRFDKADTVDLISRHGRFIKARLTIVKTRHVSPLGISLKTFNV